VTALPHDPLKGNNIIPKIKKKKRYFWIILSLYKSIYCQHNYTILHVTAKLHSEILLKNTNEVYITCVNN